VATEEKEVILMLKPFLSHLLLNLTSKKQEFLKEEYVAARSVDLVLQEGRILEDKKRLKGMKKEYTTTDYKLKLKLMNAELRKLRTVIRNLNKNTAIEICSLLMDIFRDLSFKVKVHNLSTRKKARMLHIKGITVDSLFADIQHLRDYPMLTPPGD
jgi:5-methylcytosine-specific restriction endonuclease McrBC GTP-binding regulatory subunit McrB